MAGTDAAGGEVGTVLVLLAETDTVVGDVGTVVVLVVVITLVDGAATVATVGAAAVI